MTDQTSPETETLLPCPFCGMQMVLHGDYTEEAAWNFYCHADRDAPEISTCPMKEHQISTMRDMRTPDHNEAVAWNTRKPGHAQTPDLVSWSDEDYARAKNCMIEILRGNGWFIHGEKGAAEFDNAFQHAVGILSLTASPDTSTDRTARRFLCLCCEEYEVGKDGDECEFCRLTYRTDSSPEREAGK